MCNEKKIYRNQIVLESVRVFPVKHVFGTKNASTPTHLNVKI